MAWKIDLTNDTEETLDQIRAQPGWYRAVIESAGEEPKMNNAIIEYKITAPTFIGARIKDTVFNPLNSQTEDKAAVCARRAKAVMKRLGLIQKDALGRETEIAWEAATGKEVVIHVVDEKYETKNGAEGSRAGLGFLGMFPLDHPEIPVAERVRLGLPLLEGQALPKEGEAPAKGSKANGKAKGSTKAEAGATTAKTEADLSDLVNI